MSLSDSLLGILILENWNNQRELGQSSNNWRTITRKNYFIYSIYSPRDIIRTSKWKQSNRFWLKIEMDFFNNQRPSKGKINCLKKSLLRHSNIFKHRLKTPWQISTGLDSESLKILKETLGFIFFMRYFANIRNIRQYSLQLLIYIY